MTTAHIDNVHGYNCLIPNTVIEGDGFYVSYNDYDVELHGGVTTALVKGQMEHFYILYGDPSCWLCTTDFQRICCVLQLLQAAQK